MFKYITLFVCVLGVSLASAVSGLEGSRSSEVASLLEAVKKHQKYFDLCDDFIGTDIKSCAALLDDLGTMENDVSSAITEAAGLYEDGLDIKTEFSKCSTENIFKQITCYKSVITDAKSLAKTAEEDAQAIQATVTADVTQLESDLQSCVSSGYTSQLLNTKMSLCKLRLMFKN